MSTDKPITIIAVPMRRYANPLDVLEPDDLTALTGAELALEKMIGALAAHEMCDQERCEIYDRDSVEELLFTRERIVDLANALRAYRSITRPEDALSPVQRAVARGEAEIRRIGEMLGVPDDVIDEAVKSIDLTGKIEQRIADTSGDEQRPPAPTIPQGSWTTGRTKMDA